MDKNKIILDPNSKFFCRTEQDRIDQERFDNTQDLCSAISSIGEEPELANVLLKIIHEVGGLENTEGLAKLVENNPVTSGVERAQRLSKIFLRAILEAGCLKNPEGLTELVKTNPIMPEPNEVHVDIQRGKLERKRAREVKPGPNNSI